MYAPTWFFVSEASKCPAGVQHKHNKTQQKERSGGVGAHTYSSGGIHRDKHKHKTGENIDRGFKSTREELYKK